MDRKGNFNQVADHLSRLEGNDQLQEGLAEINDQFSDEKLFQVDTRKRYYLPKIDRVHLQSWAVQ